MLEPWAEAGFDCYAIDIRNENGTDEKGIKYIQMDLRLPQKPFTFIKRLNPIFICGFPPCDDLARIGGKYYAPKEQRDPEVFKKALDLFHVTRRIAEKYDIPWFTENPIGKVSAMWQRPTYYFHPYEYGGYLPEDDVHPFWPKYIPGRDAYSKRTCLWAGNDFVMPERSPVAYHEGKDSPQYRLLGSRSSNTKIIRSATPRGFARAVFEANADMCLRRAYGIEHFLQVPLWDIEKWMIINRK